MIIGVISDSHRYEEAIDKALDKLQDSDVIIHLGDNVSDCNYLQKKFHGRVIKVSGNCDFGTGAEKEIIEEIAGVNFFITHGHRYNVKYGLLSLKYRAQEVKSDIALYGHTHISSIIQENGICYINPGSCSMPRDGVASVAKILINDNDFKVEIIDINEDK